MIKEKIYDLMILGRDRIHITLEQVQKAIELTKNAGLSDVVEMLVWKEEEIKEQKEQASQIIQDFKENFYDDN